MAVDVTACSPDTSGIKLSKMGISQQHTLLPELFQQRFDLVVLELDDLLLTFIGRRVKILRRP